MKIEAFQEISLRAVLRIAVCALLVATFTLSSVQAQTLDNDRRRGVEMLDLIKKDIKKNYYDPSFRGIDLDSHFKTAEEKVKQAASMGEIQGIIARMLMDFKDSHTGFLMPRPRDLVEQGWVPGMIGDRCYVIAVKPGSDAEAKGLKPGDEILSLAGYTPTRDELWKIWYFWRFQPGISIVVSSGGKEMRALTVMAKVKPGQPVHNLRSTTGSDWVKLIRQWENDAHLWRHRAIESDDLIIWKMPSFDSESNVDSIMGKARKRKALILDLRSNPGGYVDTLLKLIGYMFDHDVKIGEIKSRKETKPLIAKTRGANQIFNGKLVVLVDSNSGSSAEVFASVIQREKRGVVIGDRTSGKVMQAMAFPHQSGMDSVFYYGVSVTTADLIMSDGKSLEGVGVSPDELLLPTGGDLAAKRDPVLSRAAELVGAQLTPEKAGTFFPIEWRQ